MYVDICLMPITLMSTETMSKIGEGRQTRTNSTNPVISAHTSSPSPSSQNEKSYHHVSLVGLSFTQPTLETTKAPALLIIYKKPTVSYGRAIFVIILVLYLALDDMCWQCFVF